MYSYMYRPSTPNKLLNEYCYCTSCRSDLSTVRSAWDVERKQFMSQIASLEEKLTEVERQSKESSVQKKEERAGLRMGVESPLDPVQEEDGYYSEWRAGEV